MATTLSPSPCHTPTFFLALAGLCFALVSLSSVALAADDVDRFQGLGGVIVRAEENGRGAVIRAWVGPMFQGDIPSSVDLLPPSVEDLMFDQSGLSDRDLSIMNLTKFANVHVIGFDFCKVSGRYLNRLAPLPKLECLHMSATKLTDREVININMLSHLTVLSLDQCHISDVGVATLRLPELLSISPSGTRVSEDVPLALKGCPKLELLRVCLRSPRSGRPDVARGVSPWTV